jgi:DNA helicase-2/ATP-dependent DNA helicase PcrA
VCKDLTAYLKASVDNNDMLDFMQVINKPVRYITRESINKVKSSITSIEDYQILNSFKSTGLKEFQIQRISELLNNLRSIKYMNPAAAVNFIRHSVGYENYISTYCSESGIPYSELSDILDEYEVSASPFNTIIKFLSHIDEVTSMIYQYRDKNSVLPKDGVTLSTIHGAKGLEYTCIFIAGVAEGLLPHKKNMKTQGNIEEERRLFYVALTRAKEMLYISSPQKYHGKPAQPSRFYDEILNISKMLI